MRWGMNGSSTDAISRRERALVGMVAVLAWVALVLQFVLLLAHTHDTIGPLLGAIRYFSYFTILSNIVVAVVCSKAAFGFAVRVDGFFSTARVRGAAALYIAVTGGIHVTVLRTLWQPQGTQWLADVLLHYAVPALYLLLWLVFAPKGRLRWSDALRWLLFPLLYLLWTFWRGMWAHEYPYPFLDVGALGLPMVLRNACGIFGLFLALGLVLVAIDHALGQEFQRD